MRNNHLQFHLQPKEPPTLSLPQGGGDLGIGDPVWYEVARKDGDDFRVPAVVVAKTPRRLTIRFKHWSDGRMVSRTARPHRVSLREEG